jgi:hypothetical protein
MKDPEGGSTPIGGEPITPDPDRPALNETQRWQALLEEAESEIADLEARVAELEAALADAQSSAGQAARHRTLEQELARAGAIDTETVALLLAPAMADQPEADIGALVRDLRERKPFLFAATRPRAGASMGPAVPVDELGELATDARHTGDRAALLRYLRRRRVR